MKYPGTSARICSLHFVSGKPSKDESNVDYVPTQLFQINSETNSNSEVPVRTRIPWVFESLIDFLYYNCPDCEFKSKKKETFINHAVDNHGQCRENLSSESNELRQEKEAYETEVIEKKKTRIRKKIASKKIEAERELVQSRTCLNCNLISETYKKHVVHRKKCDKTCHVSGCGYHNNEIRHVRRHLHRVHGIIRPGAIVCDLCANVSYSRFENQEHHKLVHELTKPPKENHVCEDCGKEFAKVKHLRVHKSRAHQDVSIRTCKVCSVVFPNVAEVYKHHL